MLIVTSAVGLGLPLLLSLQPAKTKEIATKGSAYRWMRFTKCSWSLSPVALRQNRHIFEGNTPFRPSSSLGPYPIPQLSPLEFSRRAESVIGGNNGTLLRSMRSFLLAVICSVVNLPVIAFAAEEISLAPGDR